MVRVKCSELELSLTQVGFSFSRVPSSENMGNGLEQRPRSVGQARSGALVPPSDAATTPYSRGLKPEARNCGRRQPGRSDVRTLGFESGRRALPPTGIPSTAGCVLQWVTFSWCSYVRGHPCSGSPFHGVRTYGVTLVVGHLFMAFVHTGSPL